MFVHQKSLKPWSRNNESVSHLLSVVKSSECTPPATLTTPSLLTVISMSSYCLAFIVLPSCHNKKMHFSNFSCTEHILAFHRNSGGQAQLAVSDQSYYQREWRNHFSTEREILTVIYQGLGFGKRLSVSEICDSVSSLKGLLGAGEVDVNDKLYLMT